MTDPLFARYTPMLAMLYRDRMLPLLDRGEDFVEKAIRVVESYVRLGRQEVRA